MEALSNVQYPPINVMLGDIQKCASSLLANAVTVNFPLDQLWMVHGMMCDLANGYLQPTQVPSSSLPNSFRRLDNLTMEEFWPLPYQVRQVFMKVCPNQMNCDNEGCVRVHGEFDPDQQLEFDESNDAFKGNTACRDQLLRGCCKRSNCGFRHFKSLKPAEGMVRHFQKITMLLSSWERVSSRTYFQEEAPPSPVFLPPPQPAQPKQDFKLPLPTYHLPSATHPTQTPRTSSKGSLSTFNHQHQQLQPAIARIQVPPPISAARPAAISAARPAAISASTSAAASKGPMQKAWMPVNVNSAAKQPLSRFPTRK